MATGVVFEEIYLQHETGGHPENKQRLINTVSYLKETGTWERLKQIPARAASVDEICYNHDRGYVEKIRDFIETRGGGILDHGDTIGSPKSYEAALWAAGGLLEACDAVMKGEISNAAALVRPPGHHATSSSAMGFCIFNNVAIAARHLQKKHGLRKIAIIDWDVHHGNGTQDSFYMDPDVFYFSTHRYPFYPGTGSEGQTGQGEGEGATLNLPFSLSDRAVFLEKFKEALEGPVAQFAPEFVLVSAGYDAYVNDPIAGLGLEIEDFGALTRGCIDLAKKTCGGKVVSTLEGGYNLQDIPRCIEEHFKELMKEE